MSVVPIKNQAEWAAYVNALDPLTLQELTDEGNRLWQAVHEAARDVERMQAEVGRFAVRWLDGPSDSLVRLMRTRRSKLAEFETKLAAACVARDVHYTPEGHREFVARGGAR